MAEQNQPIGPRKRASYLVPRIGEVLAGKYLIEGELGRGGMGIVFAATNRLTRKRVAIKWMLPRLSDDRGGLERFLREAEVAGSIDHPNVVTIYDVGFEDEAAFIVMELLSGELLSSLLKRRGRLSLAEAMGVLLPAMRGVEAAHARHVVHRDLKPENIFVCNIVGEQAAGQLGHVKVLDFGVSKVLASAGAVSSAPLTETGALVGTPHYMSPEQATEAKNLDGRVDVYAFGVMLYEALTGERPFVASNCFELLLRIGQGGARPIADLNPDLPGSVARVIERAMQPARELRYPSVAALRTALQQAACEPAATSATLALSDAQDVVPASTRATSGSLSAVVLSPSAATPPSHAAGARGPRTRLALRLGAIVAVVGLAAAAWLIALRPAEHAAVLAAPAARAPTVSLTQAVHLAVPTASAAVPPTPAPALVPAAAASASASGEPIAHAARAVRPRSIKKAAAIEAAPRGVGAAKRGTRNALILPLPPRLSLAP